MPNRLDQTEVFVKINSRQIVSSDQLHLNLDVAALKDGVPVPQQSVFLEVGNSKKIVQTNENGIAENQVVIFEFIYGTRLKLLAWANELQKSAYDVSPDGYEEKIREEIIEKERKENLLRKREELEKLKQEFESTKEEEVKRRLKKKMQEIKEEMEQDEAQRKDTIRKLLEDQKALGLLKEKTDAERQSFQKEIDELKTKLEQRTDIIRQAVRAEIDELKQKVIALTPRPLSNEKLTEDEREEFQLVVKAGEEKLLDKNVYEVKKDIIVEEGGKLIIQPGAELHFEPAAGIVCYGQLIAEGTEESPIIFREALSKKMWRNITLLGKGANGSSLTHCTIANGKGREFIFDGDLVFVKPDEFDERNAHGGGIAALNTEDIKLNHVQIIQCDENGVEVIGSTIQFHNCTINNNRGQGLLVIKGKVLLEECNVLHNEEIGICVGGKTEITIKRTRVGNGAGKGITISSLSNCEILDSEVSSNEQMGINVSNAKVCIENSEIKINRGGGIHMESGRMIVKNTKILKNSAKLGAGVYISSGSGMLENCHISQNSAEIGGGIFLGKGSSMSLNNLYIQRNRAREGSGIYIHARVEIKQEVRIKNHWFWGEQSETTFSPVFNFPSLKNICVALNEGGAGIYIASDGGDAAKLLYRGSLDKAYDDWKTDSGCSCEDENCSYCSSSYKAKRAKYNALIVARNQYMSFVEQVVRSQLSALTSKLKSNSDLKIEGNTPQNLTIGEPLLT